MKLDNVKMCVYDTQKIARLMSIPYFLTQSMNESYFKWLSILRDCKIYTGIADGAEVGVIVDTKGLVKVIFRESGEVYSGVEINTGLIECKNLLGNSDNSNRSNSHMVVNINTKYWHKSFTVGIPRIIHLVFNGEYFLDVLSSPSKSEAAYCINHKDNNGWNNSYDNLEMCSSSENKIHAEYVKMICNFRPDVCHKVKNKLVLNNGISYQDIFDFRLEYSSELDELDGLKKQGKISDQAYQKKRCELFIEYIGW